MQASGSMVCRRRGHSHVRAVGTGDPVLGEVDGDVGGLDECDAKTGQLVGSPTAVSPPGHGGSAVVAAINGQGGPLLLTVAP